MRLLNVCFLAFALGVTASAQATAGKSVFVPGLFGPHRVLKKPDLTGLDHIRFVTTDDYPPFHFALPNGTLTGFDVDLARAICEALRLACTIQVRRFDLLAPALKSGAADAMLAALRIDAANRKKFSFTVPYYTTPARFVTLTKSPLAATPKGLAGKTVGVLAKTAHEAYLDAFFPKAKRKLFKTRAAMRAALQHGKIDAFFDDAITSSFWLAGTESQACCAFRGGPYTESRYFGEGVGIAVKKGNRKLRDALDYGLALVAKKGIYTDLYLKYFPIGFY